MLSTMSSHDILALSDGVILPSTRSAPLSHEHAPHASALILDGTGKKKNGLSRRAN